MTTGKKNRDTNPEINVARIPDFAESFIDSCDLKLDVVDFTNFLQGLCLLLVKKLKQSTTKL